MTHGSVFALNSAAMNFSATPSAPLFLPDRPQAMPITNRHFVHGQPLQGPFPAPLMTALFGLGCFWGAERIFWELSGVFTTAVGYAGGGTKNATYQDVCSGQSGHAEVVLVVFDPKVIGYAELLRVFWQSHNPTQGMRQGNDCGTQYRSAIYTYDAEQSTAAQAARTAYQQKLTAAGHATITTEISPVPDFFYAEDAHQQYLAKNPQGYCGLGGTGVAVGE